MSQQLQYPDIFKPFDNTKEIYCLHNAKLNYCFWVDTEVLLSQMMIPRFAQQITMQICY